jgi:hypothetical protein
VSDAGAVNSGRDARKGDAVATYPGESVDGHAESNVDGGADGNADGNADEKGGEPEWRKPGMILACADYDQPRVLRWLWPGYLPFGALSFFDDDRPWSDPFSLDLIMRVTRGLDMPDGSPGLDGPVLLLHPGAEYDPEGDYALLRAAGVDERRILALDAIPTQWDPESGFIACEGGWFPRDTQLLAEAIQQFGLKLLIIDDLDMFLEEPLDHRRYHDVRAGLTPLARLARRVNLPVLILRCAPTIFPSLGSARIKWVGQRNYTVEELLTQDRPRRAKRKDLDTWLRETLAEGPVQVKELEWRAEYEGWTLKQLYVAKARLGVAARRRGFGAGSASYWALDEDD